MQSKTVKKSNLFPPLSFLGSLSRDYNTRGRTDRRSEADSWFSQFCERAFSTEYEIYTSSSETGTDSSKEKCVLMFMS
jgi:hypothetical protein